jgi:hypothetical protein
MMRVDTQAVTLNAPAGTVFDFLADPENLPKWAVGFAHGIRRSGDEWRVRTAQGEVGIRFVTNRDRRTIDFHIAPVPGIEVVAYSRVLDGPAGSEYVFTQFQTPDMPDTTFDGQVHALREELAVLQGIMRARGACPS